MSNKKTHLAHGARKGYEARHKCQLNIYMSLALFTNVKRLALRHERSLSEQARFMIAESHIRMRDRERQRRYRQAG